MGALGWVHPSFLCLDCHISNDGHSAYPTIASLTNVPCPPLREPGVDGNCQKMPCPYESLLLTLGAHARGLR